MICLRGKEMDMELKSASIKELIQRIETSDMAQFCAVAKELIQRNSREAYEVLKKYVFSSDIYKRRYILSVIFEYSYAIELVDELDKELRAEDTKAFMITTTLEVLIKYGIKTDEDTIIQALKNSDLDYGWYYQVIGIFDKNEENLEKLLELYKIKRQCTSIRVVMAEQLLRFANEENYIQLFQLFQKDEQAHIRMVACDIAKKMNRMDLLLSFKDDKDGHVRKFAIKSLEEAKFVGEIYE